MRTLEALFDHNRWANERLLDGCRGLTAAQFETAVPGTYGDLGATLAHIASGEVYYTQLLTHWKPPKGWQQNDPFPGVDPLLDVVRETGRRLMAAAETMPGDHLIERDPGEMIPAAVIFVQAIDHATEHRAHARTILTQIGVTPPDVDGWSHGGVPG